MTPLVSIIIPVYNSEKFIKNSLESVFKQTYKNKEIIIVDDGSTDNSYALAKIFASENCKVFQQKNSGAAVARNLGLSVASGKYIQFLDVDDYLSDDKIEKQVNELNGTDNKLAVCNYVNFKTDDELIKASIAPDQSSFIYSTDQPANFLVNLWGGHGTSNFIQTNSWLLPRAIIEKSGGWRNYRCPDDDGEFFARVILASEGIVYVPGICNFYRRSDNEHKLSANKNKKYIQNTLLTIDLKYKYLQAFINSDEMKRAIATQYLNFSVFNFPQHKILSKIAWRRYKTFKKIIERPPLGGGSFQFIADLLGWKVARTLRYYLREKF